jgi:hypothetical protein
MYDDTQKHFLGLSLIPNFKNDTTEKSEEGTNGMLHNFSDIFGRAFRVPAF